MTLESSILDRNLNNPRNYGMFDNQSTNTMQNSIKTYSIPKEQRFRSLYVKAATDCFYDVRSELGKKTTGLGYGERTDFRYVRGKGVPSPDTYTMPSTLNKRNAASIKSRIPNNELLNKARIPAPGDYNIISKNTTLPTTLKFRHGLYYDDELKLKGHCLSPQAYSPSIVFTHPSRYKEIKFSCQQRIAGEISKEQKNMPGPGQYNLPSVFDLKRKYKPSIN